MTNLTIDKEIESAIGSTKMLVSLATQTPFNLLRFEECRIKVLALDLGEIPRLRLGKCFQKAARCAEFGEIGAFQYELNLLIDILKQYQDTLLPFR